MDSIITGDVDTAKEAMRQHIYNQELIVIKNLKKQEDEAKSI
jgi:DNA-binding GntR family transcriptional regulator